MTFFLDRHDFDGVTAEDVAAAHLRDLEVQGRFDVRFLTYWFDDERQTVSCLAEAPDAEAVAAVHRESHGLIPNRIIPVDPSILQRFMGGIGTHPDGEPYVETAFRTILFTDIAASTRLTQRLGDANAMVVLRTHDRIVRRSLAHHGGSEVKHTGDGLMASFRSVADAIRAAIEIQRALARAEAETPGQVRVRIGMAAGEPVTEGGDLFGATVQMAARLCARAEPGGILVSGGVHDLALGKGFAFGPHRRVRLKGFDEPASVYEVSWRATLEAGRFVAGSPSGAAARSKAITAV